MGTYGICRYGRLKYGAAGCTVTGIQGEFKNAKQDTVFLSDVTNGLDGDVSQELTDLTDSTTFFFESPSARTNIVTPREISIVADIDTGSTGTFAINGTDNLSYNWQVRTTGTGVIQFREDTAAILLQLAPPGLSGTLQRYLIHWSKRPNSLTTGASDAIRHELSIYNYDTQTWAFATADTPTYTPLSPKDFVVKAVDTAGGSTYTDTIHSVRVSSAFHSTTEAANDWVRIPTPPTLTGVQRANQLPLDKASNFGDDGEMVGPQWAFAASAHKEAIVRTMSPLVNYVANTTRTVQFDDDDAWRQEAQGSTTQFMWVSFMRWVPLRPFVTHARVRVFVGEQDGTPTSTTFRCYSSNVKPGAFEDRFVVETFNFVEKTATIAATGSSGWVDMGLLPLVRSPISNSLPGADFTILYLSFDENAGSAGFIISAWTVDPVATESVAGQGAVAEELQP